MASLARSLLHRPSHLRVLPALYRQQASFSVLLRPQHCPARATLRTSTLSCSSATANVYTVAVTGTSGTIVHSATVTVTVTDFTVTASPTSVTAVVVATATSTI